MAQYITINSNQFEDLINALSGGGGGGNVADVYVNGVSALDSNHIAQIMTHKELTITEYNALSVLEKNNGILYLVKPDDPAGYVFHESNDHTIVIRQNQNLNENLLFFNGFVNATGESQIPSEISMYIPANYFGYAPNYPNAGNTQDGWGGFYNNSIRLWSQDLGTLTAGTMWGVVDLNSSTTQQISQYSDPYDILTTGTYAIYHNSHKFAEYTEGV